MVLAVGNDAQFAKLCEALGLPELARDERFVKNQARVRNLEVLTPIIAAKFREKDRKHWVDVLDAAGVPAGPINTIPEVFEDAQVKHRRMLIDVPHPQSGTVRLVASPMRFAQAPLAHDRAPPLLGEHSVEVLRELGIDDAAIDALRKNAVV
jgi:crotonobetainyl-CoA:carnitine CoA-transferase CaiB-like acyl-CoA transferase